MTFTAAGDGQDAAVINAYLLTVTSVCSDVMVIPGNRAGDKIFWPLLTAHEQPVHGSLHGLLP